MSLSLLGAKIETSNKIYNTHNIESKLESFTDYYRAIVYSLWGPSNIKEILNLDALLSIADYSR